MEVTCPYCQKPAELVKGAVLYPHRSDLHDKNFWRCRRCKAWVGCHRGSEKPLGRLANAALRRAKMAAHEALDPLWREQGMSRGGVYRWLAEVLEIPVAQCHIGMFDEAQCRAVVKVVRARREGKAT